MGQGSPFMLYAVIGAVVLGLAIAFAMMRSRGKRTPAQQRHADAATRAGYNAEPKVSRSDEPNEAP